MMVFENLKFILVTLGLVAMAYIVLSITVPFVADIAFETANNTSVANFSSAQAGLRWTPILLYIAPAAIGLTAIVLKLRSGGDYA